MVPIPSPSTFARQVAELRQQLKWTQQQLAAALGVSFATVNRWENGKTEPSQLARKTFQGLTRKRGVVKMLYQRDQMSS